ncbi:MAG: NUDIX domain-containing protein [Methanomassiliicoccales archaeon]|nr:NUDIX domain-containing protein [Methanomassiliicoccales archaeon]
MAQAMSYGLRTEVVLTRDGRDIMDNAAYRTLNAVRSAGVSAAALEMKVSEATIYRRLRTLDRAIGGRTFKDGEVTPLGSTLLEQMERYERLLREQMEHLWKKPTLTCDAVVVHGGKLLLVRRGRDPYKGMYALPGGILEYGESAEECVIREVIEETGLRTDIERMVGVFSDPGRDPRGHFVTILYQLRMTGGNLAGGDDAESAEFFPLDQLPPLAFDHAILLRKALAADPEHSL